MNYNYKQYMYRKCARPVESRMGRSCDGQPPSSRRDAGHSPLSRARVPQRSALSGTGGPAQ